MTQEGILHDYDLRANCESSATKQTCAVCGASPMTFQWSDYSGEAMCTQCGCPYQLKWGDEEQRAGGKYPYLNVAPEWIPILREYWEETHEWVCHGMMMGAAPGRAKFNVWVLRKHPEMIPDDAKALMEGEAA